MNRPDKHEYYMNIALAVSKRSTCLRRHYGAIIVKDDEIISTGYNGSPRGCVNCIDKKECLRESQKIKPGTQYELCEAVHAEQNAIISASRKDMIGSTLYLIGTEIDETFTEHKMPCSICSKMILNAGIKYVYVNEKNKANKIRPVQINIVI